MDIRIKIALAIHDIFENKVKDSIDTIKAKLRKQLRLLKYTNDKNIFIHANDFWIDFNKYNCLAINDKQLLRILYTTNKEVTPIAYLTLILFLFNSIDEFNNFKINSEECEKIYHSKDCHALLYKPITNNKMTEYDWNMVFNEKYNEFEVVQVINSSHFLIKHKICNESWIIHRSTLWNNKMKCPICSNLNKYNNYKKRIYKLVGNEYLLLNYEVGTKKSVFLHNDPNCMKKIYLRNFNFMRLKHCTECGKDKNSSTERMYYSKSKTNI